MKRLGAISLTIAIGILLALSAVPLPQIAAHAEQNPNNLPGANQIPSGCPSPSVAVDTINASQQFESMNTTALSFYAEGLGYSLYTHVPGGAPICSTEVTFVPSNETVELASDPSIEAAVALNGSIPYMRGIAYTAPDPVSEYIPANQSSSGSFSCSSPPSGDSCNWGAAEGVIGSSSNYYKDVEMQNVVVPTPSQPSVNNSGCCLFSAWPGLTTSWDGYPTLAQAGIQEFIGQDARYLAKSPWEWVSPNLFWEILGSKGTVSNGNVNPESYGCGIMLQYGDDILVVTYQTTYNGDTFSFSYAFDNSSGSVCSFSVLSQTGDGPSMVPTYAIIVAEDPSLPSSVCTWSYGQGNGDGICELAKFTSFSGTGSVYVCTTSSQGQDCNSYGLDGSATGTLTKIQMYQGCYSTDNVATSFSGSSSFSDTYQNSNQYGLNCPT